MATNSHRARTDTRMHAISGEWFHAIFTTSPFPMSVTAGPHSSLSVVNDALAKLTGYRRAELQNTSLLHLVHPGDSELASRSARTARHRPGTPVTANLRLITRHGQTVHVRSMFAAVTDLEGNILLLTQSEDVTAQRAAEEALQRQVEVDVLTGLGTRAWLIRTLTEIWGAEARISVLLIDIDSFALINNTRGHHIGDEVLVQIARRLAQLPHRGLLVSRFGGDEFVVALAEEHPDDLDFPVRVEDLAAEVLAVISTPISTSSGAIHVTASIGIYQDRTVVDSPPLEVLRRADHAMYLAKQRGKARWTTYTTELHRENADYVHIEGLLQNALEEGRLVLHYQPIVNLTAGTASSVEVLLRLVDLDGDLIGPDRFIPVAERSGLIIPIGAWVLAESCRQIGDLRRETGRDLRLSVNISPGQAARHDLVDTVSTALADADLPAETLVLELTESALLDANASTLRRLYSLRAMGVGIAIDDFGTGYSSLTYLRSLPVSRVKIDRSFITGMTDDPSDAVIVRAVTGLVTDLEMAWVAEGIETEQQWAALRGLGTGYGQGYLFSRPMPINDLRHYLSEPPHRPRHTTNQ